MQVAAGDMPRSKACPAVRHFFEVLERVTRRVKQPKGKKAGPQPMEHLREFREMYAEVFKLLPREDTLLLGKAETIFIGPGADEAADEELSTGERVIETEGTEIPQ